MPSPSLLPKWSLYSHHHFCIQQAGERQEVQMWFCLCRAFGRSCTDHIYSHFIVQNSARWPYLITREPQEFSHHLVNSAPNQIWELLLTIKVKWEELDSGHKLSVGVSNIKHKFLPFTYIWGMKIKGFMGKLLDCW